MSRALGAAFLNHQVQQLEKSVENGLNLHTRGYNNAYGSNGPAQGQRRFDGPGKGRRGGLTAGDRGLGGGAAGMGGKRGRHPGGGKNGYYTRGQGGENGRDVDRGSDGDEKDAKNAASPAEKDADVVVVDASLLVHAIGELKRWCKPRREEIVPLDGE